MSLLKEKIESNVWLWAAFGALVFAAFGCLPLLFGVKEPESLWEMWLRYLRGEFARSSVNYLALLGIETMMRGACSFLAGWLTQALIMTLVFIRKRPAKQHER